MIKARVVKDAKYLLPHPEHENFTHSSEMVEEGTILKGVPRIIKGKKKDQPFDYRVFVTEDDKILYLNTVEPMEVTEVKLGADGAQSPTTVNLTKAELFSTLKITGIVIGGLAGYMVARKKKQSTKKAIVYVAVGAAAGYGICYLIDSNRKITVKPSK